MSRFSPLFWILAVVTIVLPPIAIFGGDISFSGESLSINIGCFILAMIGIYTGINVYSRAIRQATDEHSDQINTFIFRLEAAVKALFPGLIRGAIVGPIVGLVADGFCRMPAGFIVVFFAIPAGAVYSGVIALLFGTGIGQRFTN